MRRRIAAFGAYCSLWLLLLLLLFVAGNVDLGISLLIHFSPPRADGLMRKSHVNDIKARSLSEGASEKALDDFAKAIWLSQGRRVPSQRHLRSSSAP